MKKFQTYLLLTKFEVCSVSSYRSSFSPFVGEKTGSVNKIFIISLRRVWTISIHTEWLPISDAHGKQNIQFEIDVKSLAFNTQIFKVKESFQLLLAIKVKNTWW